MLMTNSPSPRLPTWLRACLLAALLPGLAACKGSSADISGTGSPKAAIWPKAAPGIDHFPLVL